MRKTCRLCQKELPLSEFHSHKGHKDGLHNWCKPCTNAKARASPRTAEKQRAYRARYAERHKELRRLRRYGVDGLTYQAMHTAQNGRCAICNGTETYEHKELCVDHDHETGQVRDLLCTRCNKALGGFKDDPELLAIARDYLLRHWSSWQAARTEERQEAAE